MSDKIETHNEEIVPDFDASVYESIMDTKNGIKTTVVPYWQFADIEFIPPARFFIKMATGDYMFFHSSNRAKVQEKIDSMFGKGKYRPISSK